MTIARKKKIIKMVFTKEQALGNMTLVKISRIKNSLNKNACKSIQNKPCSGCKQHVVYTARKGNITSTKRKNNAALDDKCQC